jgi:hypothetical protein
MDKETYRDFKRPVRKFLRDIGDGFACIGKLRNVAGSKSTPQRLKKPQKRREKIDQNL